MIIETAAQLNRWSREQAEAAGALAGLDQAAADHAVECIASVVWRHAVGQGVRLGDDWGWIVELYDAQRLRDIVAESIQAQAATASRRRRRGY